MIRDRWWCYVAAYDTSWIIYDKCLQALILSQGLLKLLILTTSAYWPWFTTTYWVIYGKCQKCFDLRYLCLKWVYDLARHKWTPVLGHKSILNQGAPLFDYFMSTWIDILAIVYEYGSFMVYEMHKRRISEETIKIDRNWKC